MTAVTVTVIVWHVYVTKTLTIKGTTIIGFHGQVEGRGGELYFYHSQNNYIFSIYHLQSLRGGKKPREGRQGDLLYLHACQILTLSPLTVTGSMHTLIIMMVTYGEGL